MKKRKSGKRWHVPPIWIAWYQQKLRVHFNFISSRKMNFKCLAGTNCALKLDPFHEIQFEWSFVHIFCCWCFCFGDAIRATMSFLFDMRLSVCCWLDEFSCRRNNFSWIAFEVAFMSLKYANIFDGTAHGNMRDANVKKKRRNKITSQMWRCC